MEEATCTSEEHPVTQALQCTAKGFLVVRHCMYTQIGLRSCVWAGTGEHTYCTAAEEGWWQA